MTTLNISLPESMRTFIEEQIAKGSYSTASEYIHHLIQQDQRQAAHMKLEAMLLEGLGSGEPIEITNEWWGNKRTELVERSRQENGEKDEAVPIWLFLMKSTL